MSDNTQIIGPGTGDVVSTEDTGLGYKIPRTKICLGTHGLDGSDISPANPLPVTGTVIATGISSSSSVTVVNIPTVSIIPSGTQNVSVVGTPNVNIGSGGGVSITNTPTVNISAGQSITTVTSGTQNVNVTNTPNVAVTNVPSVNISAAQFVTAVPTGTQNVNIIGTPTVVATGITSSSSITIVAATTALATNADVGLTNSTAPTKAILGALQYNTSTPVLAGGQTNALQGDTSGNLLVSLGSTMANVIAKQIYLTLAPTLSNSGTQQFLCDANGNLKVNLAVGNISSSSLVTLVASTVTQSVVQTFNGSLVSVSNPLPVTAGNDTRNSGTAHRVNISSVDKVANATNTTTAATEAGSTLPNTLMYIGVAAGNRWGSSGVTALSSLTPTASQAIRTSIPQVAGADYYDIFCSTAVSAPSWVARITEAQRAAGGYMVSTVGTVTLGGGAGANYFDIGIVGTGLASTLAPFNVNNAYTPTLVTGISCAGYSRAHVQASLTLTDLRSLPTFSVIPFFQSQLSVNQWYAGSVQSVPIGSSVGQPLEQDFIIDVDGSTGFAVLIDTMTGQGATANVAVELVK